ncbi:MAG: hypothetical protein ACLFS5_12200 [Spirochaetaceae bacterium]
MSARTRSARGSRSTRNARGSRGSHGAQGGLPFLRPRFSPVVHALLRTVSPLYLRFGEGIAAVRLRGADTLVSEMKRFEAGESRLIIAFRHPSVSDGPLLGHAISRLLPREARRAGCTAHAVRGRRLRGRRHVHFVYGREVPVWAGRALEWILPRVGAVPVNNGRLDSQGLAALRELALNGRFSLALAPEGQVTYHNAAVGELEAGTGRIALWCRDDLRSLGRDEEVRVVPVGITYRYPQEGRPAIGRAVRWVAERTGLELDLDVDLEGGPEAVRAALLELTDRLLALLEAAYGLPRESAGNPVPVPVTRRRIETLCDAVLQAGEAVHGLPAEGSFLSRVFRLREAGRRRIFRDDLALLSSSERAAADVAADEARRAARHMELADVLEYVDPGYIGPGASFGRLAEYAMNLQDITNRFHGGTIAARMKVPGRTATVSVGVPISAARTRGDGSGARQGDPRGPREGGGRAEAARINKHVAAELARLAAGAD